jgi:hypothetical protein
MLISPGLLLSANATAQPASAPPAGKHALLIGISDYHEVNHSGLFPDLHCNEDIARISAALVNKFGFKADPAAGEITRLIVPADTTRAAIISAFEKLITQTNKGDLVYIHYAGHGAQIVDETKSSGRGDAIVPSDYDDELTNVIKGKELGAFLKRLREKATASGQIVFTMDCCHSGTGSRAGATALKRGIDYLEYSDRYAKLHNGRQPPAPKAPVPPATDSAGVPQDLRGNDYVVISACTDLGSAFEMDDGGTQMGRLSYCLADALNRATPRTTYRDLFEEVRSVFAEKFQDQRPQVDGNPDVFLFGGRASQPPAAIKVEKVSIRSGVSYVLQAGKLHGITGKSTYTLYSGGASVLTAETKIGEAEIKPGSINLATAEFVAPIKLNLGHTVAEVAGCKAVELRHNYESPPISLDPESVRLAVPAKAAAILALLNDPDKGLGMVRTDPVSAASADLRLFREKPSAPLELIRNDTGFSIRTLDESGDVPQQVFEALQREARRRYVLDLGALQPQLNRTGAVHIRLVPANGKKDADGNWVFESNKTMPEGSPMHIGDFFTVEVQNTDHRQLHIAVLDLESGGNISLAWPDPDSTVEDNVIPQTKPGEWRKLWIGSDVNNHALYRCATEDPGEIFKAIGTVDYVPFASLARGARRGGPAGAFDALLGPTVNAGTRSVERTVVVAPDSWTASSTTFVVVK